MSRWREVDLKLLRPPARGGHCCALLQLPDPCLVVIGGADPFGVAYNDVFAVDADTGHAVVAAVDGAPPAARCGHAAEPFVSAGSGAREVVVFGGMQAVPQPRVFGDVWRLSCAAATHSGADEPPRPVVERGLVFTWRPLEASGAAPSPRHACATASNAGCMFVVGGSDGEVPLSDAFELTVGTGVWRVLRTSLGLGAEMMAAAWLYSGGLVCCGGRTAASPSSTVTVMGEETATFEAEERMCHTMVPVSATTAVAIGGMRGMAPADSDMFIDVAGRTSAARRRVRVAPDGDAPVWFGLGHSSCHAVVGGAPRTLVVEGLHPNAVGNTMAVFEMVVCD